MRSRKDVKYVNRCSLAYNACATLLVGLHFSPKGCFRAAFGAFARRPFRRRTEWARSGYRAHSVQTRCPWRGDRDCSAGCTGMHRRPVGMPTGRGLFRLRGLRGCGAGFHGVCAASAKRLVCHRAPGALPMPGKAFQALKMTGFYCFLT